MDQISFSKMPLEERSIKYSQYIAELWKIHPFREGNTRSTLIFATHYAEAHGFHLYNDLFKNNAEYVRGSLVLASIGKYSEYKYMQSIFKDSMIMSETTYCTNEIKKAGFKPTQKLIDTYMNANMTFGKSLTVREINDLYREKIKCNENEKKAIKEISDEFKKEELKMQQTIQNNKPGIDLEP